MRRSFCLSAFFALLLLVAATAANAQNCNDPWVTAALRSIGKGGASDYGNNGLCNISRYGGGQWSSQADLNQLVRGSFLCNDPWIGEAYVAQGIPMYSAGSSGDCSPQNYGGGQWSSYADLKQKVYAYKHPAPPQVVNFGTTDIVNGDGGLCIDAEGGSAAPGVRLIAYQCNGQSNQMVTLDDHLRVGGYCAQPVSSSSGAEIRLQACSSDPSQNFAWDTSNNPGGCTPSTPCISHRSGYILAAAGTYWGNRPLCLYTYQGRNDQHWRSGRHASIQPGSRVVFPSWVTEVRVDGREGVSRVVNGMISSDGAGVVAQGGGNIVGNNGNGVVAAGGGNVIAAGAGNIVASGGGN